MKHRVKNQLLEKPLAAKLPQQAPREEKQVAAMNWLPMGAHDSFRLELYKMKQQGFFTRPGSGGS